MSSLKTTRFKNLFLFKTIFIAFVFAILFLTELYFDSSKVYAKPDFGTDCASCHNGTTAPILGGAAEKPAQDTSAEQPAVQKNTSAPAKSSKPTEVNQNKSSDTKETPVGEADSKSGQTEVSTSTESKLDQPVQAKPTGNELCLSCHTNKQLSTEIDGKKVSLFVDKDFYNNSAHGKLTCTSCHTGFEQIPHQKTTEVKKLEMEKSELLINTVEQCTSCHTGKVKESYEESFHGKAIALGSTKAATCTSCHGPSHEVQVSPEAISQSCTSCHGGSAAKLVSSGPEHYLLEPEGAARPMYYTYKFFTWLTIITITLLIIHIELELFRKLKNAK